MDTVMVMGTVMDTDTVTMAIMERKTTDMEKDRSRKKRRNNATEYNNTGPIRPVYFSKKIKAKIVLKYVGIQRRKG